MIKNIVWVQAGVRVRQHVNPLRRDLQVERGDLRWECVFSDPHLPLVVDVGCGYGRFAIKLAKQVVGVNVLGIEVRQPIIERATQ
jgi:tRNA (guanine-N7-)-methyltransferase